MSLCEESRPSDREDPVFLKGTLLSLEETSPYIKSASMSAEESPPSTEVNSTSVKDASRFTVEHTSWSNEKNLPCVENASPSAEKGSPSSENITLSAEKNSPSVTHGDSREQSPTCTKSFRLGQISEAQLDLLLNGNYSDLTIFCQGSSWRVHKVIIDQRCPALLDQRVHAQQDDFRRSVTLHERDPEAVGVMLKFLYTLEECCLSLEWVDAVDFEKDPDIYNKISPQCEHLASVIAVAAKYECHGLADFAGNELMERLEHLKSHVPPDKEVLKNLIGCLVKALYSDRDVPALQTHRDLIIRLVMDHWVSIGLSDTLENLMLADPKLGWDFAKLAMSDLQRQQETMQCMKLDLPKKKRKRYSSTDS